MKFSGNVDNTPNFGPLDSWGTLTIDFQMLKAPWFKLKPNNSLQPCLTDTYTFYTIGVSPNV